MPAKTPERAYLWLPTSEGMGFEELHLKEGRTQCWGARDKYWKCLDANNEILEKCVKLRKEYEKFCSQQWVKHFDRKRQFEKFKEQMDKNAWEKPLK